MKVFKKYIFLCFVVCVTISSFGQETFPVYSDYLSDNVFLIHPSAAGIGSCGKVRFTGRKQWAGVQDAPELQTLSIHSRFGENAALGVVLFNDTNGFHSQKGVQGSYAYHLDIGNGNYFEQLSFGLSATMVQFQSDQRTFSGDPTVQQVIESAKYFNADFSISYHKLGFASYFTIKNLLLSSKKFLNNSLEPLDLRNFLFNASYYFEYTSLIQFEPSVLLQYKEVNGGVFVDVNMKVYRNLRRAQVWAVLSYRSSFGGRNLENLKHFTPIVGVNYNQMMASYTYTKQLGSLVFSDAGYHQITLGINIFCRRDRASGCPNIKGAF